VPGMTSSASTAAWMPPAIARPAVVRSTSTGPRHLAPDAVDDVMDLLDDQSYAVSTGRHAEPEWSRALFDPRRDGDAFAWLGFTDDEA
jgi:hypothetical protein